jgi:hypothetical protein
VTVAADGRGADRREQHRHVGSRSVTGNEKGQPRVPPVTGPMTFVATRAPERSEPSARVGGRELPQYEVVVVGLLHALARAPLAPRLPEEVAAIHVDRGGDAVE